MPHASSQSPNAVREGCWVHGVKAVKSPEIVYLQPPVAAVAATADCCVCVCRAFSSLFPLMYKSSIFCKRATVLRTTKNTYQVRSYILVAITPGSSRTGPACSNRASPTAGCTTKKMPIDPQASKISLHMAALSGDFKVVRALIRNPATDIEAKDLLGDSGLLKAARYGQLQVL